VHKYNVTLTISNHKTVKSKATYLRCKARLSCQIWKKSYVRFFGSIMIKSFFWWNCIKKMVLNIIIQKVLYFYIFIYSYPNQSQSWFFLVQVLRFFIFIFIIFFFCFLFRSSTKQNTDLIMMHAMLFASCSPNITHAQNYPYIHTFTYPRRTQWCIRPQCIYTYTYRIFEFS